MKNVLLFILLITNIQFVSSQMFDVVTIEENGDYSNKINLVILSDGYQESELDKFITDATNFKNALFSQSPFLEYANYFNVYAIKVPSNESGADHPVTATDTYEPGGTPKFVDTYFNATFDAFNIHRLLFYGINYADAASAESKIISVLANNFPAYDQALILVNTTSYGGTGGEFPMASVSGFDLAIHELGHSLFNLKDEYYAAGYEGEAINMTQQSNPSLVKWKNWLNINNVNIYPFGSSGIAATWYRPHQNCKMRFLGVPFCSVCKEGMVEKIHSMVSPIDSYSPVSASLNNPIFPIDFQLNLIKPIPNTLKSTWTLNTSNFANDVDNVSLTESDLNTGTNTLTVAVTDTGATDTTKLLRVDNHDAFHVYTITWNIDNSALGIEDITSNIANYNIAMYPNPTNTFVNFKFESDVDNTLKVDIIGLDGKRIKTISISNYQTNQVDISNFSTGIYLTNFYSKNILIASKKLVKN